MVFIKDPATLHRLEERRALLLPAIATSIQARWRAYAQRRR
jgi:myosin heavy subunit